MGDADLVQSFGRHETFHPRYGWLKKAYDQVVEEQKAFRADNATVLFGVGKNMVNAIRFWSLAFKITEEQKDGLEVTKTGKKIFKNGGFDPYLEMPETLWVLHWLLLSPPCRVPTWWMIINHLTGPAIKADRIHYAAWDEIHNDRRLDDPSTDSVKRDVNVFLHTYTSRRDRLTVEEYIDCPFRSMRLAHHDGSYVRFTYGPKPGLSPLVVAFACADFARQESTGRGISIARLAVDPGSPGNAFRLNESDIAGSLEAARKLSKLVSTVDTNGVPHLRFPHGAAEATDGLLEAVYAERSAQCLANAGAVQ